MRFETAVAPKNSLILVMGSKESEIPASLGGGLIAATASCVAVGTVSESDGPTRIILTNEDSDPEMPGLLAFEGTLVVPARTLGVYTVELEQLLEISLASDQPDVRIFVDHPSEPELIRIEAR